MIPWGKETLSPTKVGYLGLEFGFLFPPCGWVAAVTLSGVQVHRNA